MCHTAGIYNRMMKTKVKVLRTTRRYHGISIANISFI